MILKLTTTEQKNREGKHRKNRAQKRVKGQAVTHQQQNAIGHGRLCFVLRVFLVG